MTPLEVLIWCGLFWRLALVVVGLHYAYPVTPDEYPDDSPGAGEEWITELRQMNAAAQLDAAS